jgi:hypothetical protein
VGNAKDQVRGSTGCIMHPVATLLWPSVGVKPNTWKKLGLESSGTPESSEDDLEDQNTSH